MENTYHQHVTQNAENSSTFFMRKYFNVHPYSVKSYNSNMRNVLSRIISQLVKAVKQHVKFPKVIIFMLDDDIIRATKPSDIGATLLLTKLVEWLFKEIARIIQQRKEQLPLKAIKSDFPMVYWVEAPQHKNFTNNLLRRKLNSVVQVTISNYRNMHIMRMKKIWDPDDSNFFRNN